MTESTFADYGDIYDNKRTIICNKKQYREKYHKQKKKGIIKVRIKPYKKNTEIIKSIKEELDEEVNLFSLIPKKRFRNKNKVKKWTVKNAKLNCLIVIE